MTGRTGYHTFISACPLKMMPRKASRANRSEYLDSNVNVVISKTSEKTEQIRRGDRRVANYPSLATT